MWGVVVDATSERTAMSAGSRRHGRAAARVDMRGGGAHGNHVAEPWIRLPKIYSRHHPPTRFEDFCKPHTRMTSKQQQSESTRQSTSTTPHLGLLIPPKSRSSGGRAATLPALQQQRTNNTVQPRLAPPSPSELDHGCRRPQSSRWRTNTLTTMRSDTSPRMPPSACEQWNWHCSSFTDTTTESTFSSSRSRPRTLCASPRSRLRSQSCTRTMRTVREPQRQVAR